MVKPTIGPLQRSASETSLEQVRKRLVFVAGVHGRCGTSLMKRLLVSHPDVSPFGHGETRLFELIGDLWPMLDEDQAYSLPAAAESYFLFRQRIREYIGDNTGVSLALEHLSSNLGVQSLRLPGRVRTDVPRPLSGDRLSIAISTFIYDIGHAAALHPERPVICEKTPSNAQYLGRIESLLPDALSVVMIRHPIKVALSHTKRDWGPADPIEAAMYTAAYFRRWRDASLRCGRYLLVRHEELVKDPRGQFEEVLQHLHLTSRHELLEQVVREVKPQEDRVSKLSGDVLQEMSRILAEEMDFFGYQPPDVDAVRSTTIPLVRPSVPPFDRVAPRLREIWRSGRVTNGGPVETEFERALEQTFGWKYVSLTASGTTALQLLFRAHGLEGEVITSAFTFPAVMQALHSSGVSPVIADIDPETMTIDPVHAASLITPRTSAIVAIHTFGYPADVVSLGELARKQGLCILYDGAPAVGVRFQDRPITDFGEGTAFSFHATKVLTSIEGGAVSVSDKQIHDRIRRLRNFGLGDPRGVSIYGTNGKSNEVSSAIGLESLVNHVANVAARARAHSSYANRLNAVDGVEVLTPRTGTTPNFSYFAARFLHPTKGPASVLVAEHLRKSGIDCRRYFSQEFSVRKLASQYHTPAAVRAADEILCLPLWPGIDYSTIDRICRAVEEVLK